MDLEFGKNTARSCIEFGVWGFKNTDSTDYKKGLHGGWSLEFGVWSLESPKLFSLIGPAYYPKKKQFQSMLFGFHNKLNKHP